MKNKHNILNERPRKKNNKKVKYNDYKKTVDDNALKLHRHISERMHELLALFAAKEYVDSKSIRLNIGLCEKPQPMSKVQAFIIIALTLLAFTGFFMLVQRATDINALNNCGEHGDCAEVIRDINAH